MHYNLLTLLYGFITLSVLVTRYINNHSILWLFEACIFHSHFHCIAKFKYSLIFHIFLSKVFAINYIMVHNGTYMTIQVPSLPSTIVSEAPIVSTMLISRSHIHLYSFCGAYAKMQLTSWSPRKPSDT